MATFNVDEHEPTVMFNIGGIPKIDTDEIIKKVVEYGGVASTTKQNIYAKFDALDMSCIGKPQAPDFDGFIEWAKQNHEQGTSRRPGR